MLYDRMYEAAGLDETGNEQVSRGRAARHQVHVQTIGAEALASAKSGFSTRRVDSGDMKTLISGAVRPRTGDLVLARVDRIRYHTRLELPGGRKASLQPGDKIIVAYGDRYATDQFEAEVPIDLRPTHLIATGGVASTMLSRTQGMKAPTEITPLGLIGDANGRPLNVSDFALPAMDAPAQRPQVFAVLGTSMNSGKTTTNRYLVSGLSRAGYKVGAAKVTGTGSGGDFWQMHDAGAHAVLDFTDAGYSSTYKISVGEIEAVARTLIGHLAAAGSDVIVLEIADGIFQEQNRELLEAGLLKDLVDGVFFAAGEALGAALGVAKLEALGLPVIGVSGKLTTSELLIREAEPVCSAPIYRKEDLGDANKAPAILSLPPLGESNVVPLIRFDGEDMDELLLTEAIG